MLDKRRKAQGAFGLERVGDATVTEEEEAAADVGCKTVSGPADFDAR